MSLPRVSIILPTFNRATFLPDAFASIAAQEFTDYEVIVVDDGSSDNTGTVVAERQAGDARIRHYVRQSNKGAYGARNTGLDHATGEYVAFFDSDDLWLPFHLGRCVAALEDTPRLDWIFAACRIVAPDGTVLEPSTFAPRGEPRAFKSLRARLAGRAHVIDDPRLLCCHIRHGLYAGLQNSVIRRRVFESRRFWEDSRVVEDAFFLLRALVAGVTIGYIDDVQVVYRVHGDNSSGSVQSAPAAHRIGISEEHARLLERVYDEVPMPTDARRVVREQLGHSYFWRLGYASLWASGDRAGALKAFRRGLAYWPWSPAMWKTYLACSFRRSPEPFRESSP